MRDRARRWRPVSAIARLPLWLRLLFAANCLVFVIMLALILRIGIKPTLSGLLPMVWYLAPLLFFCLSEIHTWFQRRCARRWGEAFVAAASYAASIQPVFDLVGVVWFALASFSLAQKLADVLLVIAAVGALVGILAVIRFATFEGGS